jgi:hypothetical protein
MPERETPVETFLVEYDCDNCGTPIVFEGIVYTVNPPIYPHYCPNCKKKHGLSTSYPTYTHRPPIIADTTSVDEGG